MSKNNSLTLICLAEGLQEFSYTVFSGEVEVKGAQNGKVIIPNYNLSNNITYKCISSNNFGYDTKYFSPASLKGMCDQYYCMYSIFNK